MNGNPPTWSGSARGRWVWRSCRGFSRDARRRLRSGAAWSKSDGPCVSVPRGHTITHLRRRPYGSHPDC
jgi:hypothetical protein